ncbi:MAG: hypothetical protein HYW23_02255 [Candidatus Aenigmarchaeota archaeon]|nr:hypothetical protein [Candidatus Aenigmarchaeota archaeon]
MKGISPIVASVLLIAITMTIAGVLAYWSSTFVSNTLPGENTTTAQCRLAQFEFLLCNYNTIHKRHHIKSNPVKRQPCGKYREKLYANSYIF